MPSSDTLLGPPTALLRLPRIFTPNFHRNLTSQASLLDGLLLAVLQFFAILAKAPTLRRSRPVKTSGPRNIMLSRLTWARANAGRHLMCLVPYHQKLANEGVLCRAKEGVCSGVLFGG